MHLGDGRRGKRLTIEAGEQLAHLSAQLGPQHLLDPGPGDFGRVVLQAAQLADELRREKITASGQHLPELDEGDPAVLHGQAHRAGQPGPALGRGQLGPASAPHVRHQAAPHQDPADLPVAPRPAHPPVHVAQHVERPRHRPARHQRLGHDQEHHADHQRDRHAQDHEPQLGQDARSLCDHRAADGRDYWRGDQERQDACDQRAQEREPQSQQPPGTDREHQHGQRGEHEDQW